MATNSTNLENSLVLHQWLLDLFGYKNFEDFATQLRDPRFEGVTEDNVTRFHGVLKALLPQDGMLTGDILLAYDENISCVIGNADYRAPQSYWTSPAAQVFPVSCAPIYGNLPRQLLP